jgi:GT2 family glycosyltransferase
MENRGETAIVIPTLRLDVAAQTGARARATAGAPCYVIIVNDFARRGGIKPANAGLRAALDLGTPYIVYMNDDVSFPRKRWLARLIDALESDPTYGVAVPSSVVQRGSKHPQQNTGPGAPIGVFVEDEPLAWHVAVMRRAMLEEIGIFDYAFIHFAGDSDLTRRMQKAGWKSVWVRDCYVHHEPGPFDTKLKRRDKKIYMARWGK